MKQLYLSNKFIKRCVLAIAIGILFSVVLYSCKKPTTGVDFIINTNIITYSSFLKIYDATNPALLPANIKVQISGQDADMIYEFSGTKNFTVSNGTLNLGVHPSRIPTEANPVKFTVLVTATDCFPVSQDIVIGPKLTKQMVGISLQNYKEVPTGLKMVSQKLVLSGGVLKETATIKLPAIAKASNNLYRSRTMSAVKSTNGVSPTDTTYYDDGQTTVVLPKGTTFYSYRDNTTGKLVGTLPITFQDLVLNSSPLPSYYSQTRNAGVTPESYTGPVTVVCYYSEILAPTNINFYQDVQNRAPTPIQLLNGTTVPDNELIYS